MQKATVGHQSSMILSFSVEALPRCATCGGVAAASGCLWRASGALAAWVAEVGGVSGGQVLTAWALASMAPFLVTRA